MIVFSQNFFMKLSKVEFFFFRFLVSLFSRSYYYLKDGVTLRNCVPSPAVFPR